MNLLLAVCVCWLAEECVCPRSRRAARRRSGKRTKTKGKRRNVGEYSSIQSGGKVAKAAALKALCVCTRARVRTCAYTSAQPITAAGWVHGARRRRLLCEIMRRTQLVCGWHMPDAGPPPCPAAAAPLLPPTWDYGIE